MGLLNYKPTVTISLFIFCVYSSTNFNYSYSNHYVFCLFIVLQSMMQFLYPYYSDCTVIISKYHHLSAEIAVQFFYLLNNINYIYVFIKHKVIYIPKYKF